MGLISGIAVQHTSHHRVRLAASVFMVLELDSNAMNRFTFTSERGVLQKVDFST